MLDTGANSCPSGNRGDGLAEICSPFKLYIAAYALVLALIVLGLHASDNWRTLLWGADLALLSGMTDRYPIETAPLIFCIVLNLLLLPRRNHVRT